MRRLEEETDPSGDVAIRRMVPEDLDEVLALQSRAFRHPWSEPLFRREMTHDWSTILVAEEGGGLAKRIVGFLILWLVHDELHVLNVATSPDRRRQGVGRRLLVSAIERARQRGCSLATLEVRRSNEAALSLYRSLGFRVAGVRPKYYSDEGEDAVVMLLDL